MALVRDFMVGNTRIQIYDDKCVSKEEAKVLVAHFSRIAQQALLEQAAAQHPEEEEEG